PYPDGAPVRLDVTPTETGPFSVNVTGLTNGRPYTFTVRATNSTGNSAESERSNSVTPDKLSQAALVVPTAGTYGDRLGPPTGGTTTAPIVSVATGNACSIDTNGKLFLSHVTDATHACTLSASKAGNETYKDVTAQGPVRVDPK